MGMLGSNPLKGATSTPYGGITDGGVKSLTHGGTVGALTNGGSLGGLTGGALDGSTAGTFGHATGAAQPLAGGLVSPFILVDSQQADTPA